MGLYVGNKKKIRPNTTNRTNVVYNNSIINMII